MRLFLQFLSLNSLNSFPTISFFKFSSVGEIELVDIVRNESSLFFFKIPENFSIDDDHQWSLHVKQVYPRIDNSTEIGECDQSQISVSDGDQSNTFKIPSFWLNNEKDVILEAVQKKMKICPEKKLSADSTLEVYMKTQSSSKITLQIDVILEQIWEEPTILDESIKHKEVLSVSQPVIKFFNTSSLQSSLKTFDYLLLSVSSSSDSPCICSLLSLQEPRCPIFDTIGMIKRYKRNW